MSAYICRFVCEAPEDHFEFSAGDHQEAAEAYAALAQDEGDMWEHGNEWEGNFAIVVKDKETGEEKTFNILREYEPVFSATEATAS